MSYMNAAERLFSCGIWRIKRKNMKVKWLLVQWDLELELQRLALCGVSLSLSLRPAHVWLRIAKIVLKCYNSVSTVSLINDACIQRCSRLFVCVRIIFTLLYYIFALCPAMTSQKWLVRLWFMQLFENSICQASRPYANCLLQVPVIVFAKVH